MSAPGGRPREDDVQLTELLLDVKQETPPPEEPAGLAPPPRPRTQARTRVTGHRRCAPCRPLPCVLRGGVRCESGAREAPLFAGAGR
jgi:hypothetical protein